MWQCPKCQRTFRAENQHHYCGKMVAKALGLTEAEYRKALTALRARIAIIENNLREQDYTFDYANNPPRLCLYIVKRFCARTASVIKSTFPVWSVARAR